MSELLIVGGRQKRTETRSSEEWSRFGEGVVLSLNTDTMALTERLSYVSPPDAVPDVDPSVVFKSGSVDGDTIHLCTQTEVMEYDRQTWERQSYTSLPFFNDVHHVTRSRSGNRLVTVTGLDLVVEIDHAGNVIQEWEAQGREPFGDRFDRSVDYRKVATTKPHHSHPNFAFQYGDEVWVSRFEQKDAICLTNPERRIDIAIERPHDGVVVGDLVYFTTVDSHIVVADLRTCEVLDVVDLYAIAETDDALGWARGLHIDADGNAVVGFSTLRVTKIRQNVRWVKERFGRMEKSRVLPTHIAAFNLEKRSLQWRHLLADPNLDVVFSVLDAPE